MPEVKKPERNFEEDYTKTLEDLEEVIGQIVEGRHRLNRFFLSAAPSSEGVAFAAEGAECRRFGFAKIAKLSVI